MTHVFPFDAVVFDMDGLLFDSEVLWKAAETDMLAALGRAYSDDTHRPLIGLGMREFLAGLRDAYALEQDAVTLGLDLLARLEQKADGNLRGQLGADALVAHVVALGVPRAIASSSPLRVIHRFIGAYGWDDVFTVRCSAEEVERGKPAPDVYLLAAERLGVDAARCLALEDSPNGARAAVAAGMTCWGVPDLSHTEPDALRAVTPHVFTDLNEVLARLSPNRAAE